MIHQFHSEYVIYKDFMNHCFFVLKLRRFKSRLFPSLGNFCGFLSDPCVAFVLGTWYCSTRCSSQFYFLGKLKHAYARETNILLFTNIFLQYLFCRNNCHFLIHKGNTLQQFNFSINWIHLRQNKENLPYCSMRVF